MVLLEASLWESVAAVVSEAGAGDGEDVPVDADSVGSDVPTFSSTFS